MTIALNILYVTLENAYLHLDNQTVRVDVERETKLRVPLHHLGGIVCMGEILVSPALMTSCVQQGIQLTFLDTHGRFRARIEGPVSGNVLLRQAQFQAQTNGAALPITRALLAGKIRNSRHVLLRGARDSKVESDRNALVTVAKHLAASLRALPVAETMDSLRGIEGDAARAYFTGLPYLLRPDLRDSFPFNGRSRRPPRDALNALMSFLYTLLTHDCRAALETVGLDPQVGCLHSLRPGRPALALDLVEEFRSVMADRMALSLINRGQIQPSDFMARDGGSFTLKPEARKTVLVAWQQKKQETLTHPLLQTPIAWGLLPHVQARLLARTLRGDTEGYLPFLAR